MQSHSCVAPNLSFSSLLSRKTNATILHRKPLLCVLMISVQDESKRKSREQVRRVDLTTSSTVTVNRSTNDKIRLPVVSAELVIFKPHSCWCLVNDPTTSN
jgi:hypothetical protein